MKTVAFALASVILATLFSACTQRMICPAFQSAYIYDKEALRKKFSYFNEDSTPKVLTASKDKYLVITSRSYRQRLRSLQTVEMKDIYPSLDSVQADLLLPPADSLAAVSVGQEPGEASDSVARLFLPPADSLAAVSAGLEQGEASDSVARADSTYMITLEKEKYNVDQDMYMWYFRDILVLPDVRIALTPPEGKKEKGGKIGAFFKNLFKKIFKKRHDADSTVSDAQAMDSLRQEEMAPLEDFMSLGEEERQQEVSSEDNEQEKEPEATEEKKRKRPKRKRQPKAKKRKNKKTEDTQETEQVTPSETQD